MTQLEHIEVIEKRLWNVADTLRANSIDIRIWIDTRIKDFHHATISINSSRIKDRL